MDCRIRWRWPSAAGESGQAMPRLVLALAFTALALLMLATAVTVYAIFSDSDSVTPNDFASDTLDPPTTLGATGGSSVDLSWTVTVDTYASGHRVLRGTASGGPYSQVAELTPRTTSTYADCPADGTYYYVVRAFYQNWESANGNEASATVSAAACPTPTPTPTATPTPTPTSAGFLSPSAEAAVTAGSGDNDGFQVTPTNVFANDGAYAGDTNSGTSNATTCTSTAKDRHQFYNYGFSLPGGATINGIEVRLDAWADSTQKAPFICVELSWDGGATWTAVPQTTSTLGTTEATFILGSASDTWGRTWTDTEFTDANFRVRITNVANSAQRDFRLDWLPVQVTYTP